MFIFPADLPEAAARQEGKLLPVAASQSTAGSPASAFADYARRLDADGEVGRGAFEGADSAPAPVSHPDSPPPEAGSNTAAATEGDEAVSQAADRSGLASTGNARDSESARAERGVSPVGDARVSSAATARVMDHVAWFRDGAHGAAPDDTATEAGEDPPGHAGTRNPHSEAHGLPSRGAQAARAGIASTSSIDSARFAETGERPVRLDSAAVPRPMAEPPRPGAEHQALPPVLQGVASDATAPSQRRATTGATEVPAAPASPPPAPPSPVLPPRHPQGDLAHGAQEGSARFLSALSALPAGESGTPAMVVGMDSQAPARGANAPLEAAPGQAQDAGRATGRAVVDQILPALQRGADGRVELTLSPAELGRVEITLQSRDGGMSISLNAERPETLELLRRHIDLLAADMRQFGMTDLSFSFGRETAGGSDENQNQRQGGSDAAGQRNPGDPRAARSDDAPAPLHQSNAIARLDLRI